MGKVRIWNKIYPCLEAAIADSKPGDLIFIESLEEEE